MPRSRDRDAMFNRTFDLHYEAVQIYCFRRLRADDVNDAVAEVFLVAWRRIDQLPAGRELPWLYAISRTSSVTHDDHDADKAISERKSPASGVKML